MNTPDSSVPTKVKEATAIVVMRCMLVYYAREQGVPFERVALEFARSKTYEDLFDFDDGIWREGPTYLRVLYEEELAERKREKKPTKTNDY